MEFIRTVLISMALLVVSGEATFLKERTHSTSAISLVLKSQGPNKVSTKDLVASLSEVGAALKKEDKKVFELAQKSKSECKKTAAKLELAMKKGTRAFDMATDDFEKADAQVKALQASLAELNGQIKSSSDQIDSLQSQLKQLRTNKGLLKKGAASSLRQVEAVIAKTYLRESNAQHRGPSALQKKVSSLEELSKSLTDEGDVSFLQTDSDSDDDGAPADDDEASGEEKPEAPEASMQKGKPNGPVLILKSDKQAVVHASEATQKGFNEKEKELLDLIEVERKKLQDLEDNLEDMQPAISNKLKQKMEIDRTKVAAKRGMDRDKKLMEVETEKCGVVKDNLAKQQTSRGKVTNDVEMASKVIEHMDTFLFLSSDLQGLKQDAKQESAPSFLQVAQATPSSSALSLLQEDEGMGLEELVENYGTSISEGPFDGVTKMIGGLIASLKAQANEEVNQHQFCEDSLGKNRRDRIAKKNGIDTLSSTIRWSEMAIVRLDDDLKYLDEEINRLGVAQTDEAKELDVETKRVNKELKDHKLADEVITKAVVILTQLCGLSSSLLQQSHSKVGSRFSQCKEAAKLLTSASKELKGLDTMTGTYLSSFTTLSNKIKGDAKSAQDSRISEKTSTKSARAQRSSELATANKDVKEAGKELDLIETAKQELEHSCSHVETREEKMARRKDQIDALKEALNVLNGESIPA